MNADLIMEVQAEREREREASEHGPAATEAITAELLRLTLGGKPERPELLLTLPE